MRGSIFQHIILRRVEDPSDERLEEAVELFYSLMKNDSSMKSLTGGEPQELLRALGRAMLRAGVYSGEYHEATTQKGELAGFLMTMPPGQDIFATEEQCAQGLTDFMSRLSDSGKRFYQTTYMNDFPNFVNAVLGPTGRRDSWYLHMIMVREDYQRKGIAKRLINVVRDKAAINGDMIALSCTTAVNAKIYQRCGLRLRGHKVMTSPWGPWPLYLLSLGTNTP